jgi:predicted RNA-binding protein (virulence factor B family)
MEIGKVNKLEAIRFAPQGCYLEDEKGNEVLLPNNRLPEKPELGAILDAFVYRDSEERLIATLDKPIAQVGDFSGLKVMEKVPFGYFLDWGLDKQILLPMREVRGTPKVGDFVPVFLYLDDLSERVAATSRLERFFNREIDDLNENDAIEITILSRDRLGFSVAVANKFQGMIYHNEIFSALEPGQKMRAFIRNLRQDGKIDLIIQKEGMDHVEPSAKKILERLKISGGSLPFHDKSDAQAIQTEFNMSKKTFKKAVGTLYKKKLIVLEKGGIKLSR